MTPSDQCARYAAKQLDAEGFLRWWLPEAFVKRRWSGWLDTQTVGFPGETERRCDTVALFERLGGDAPPVAAVIEFMSRPRGEMRERLAEYALLVRRERPFHVDPLVQYEVVTVLFNLTGPAQSDVWSMTPEDFGGLGLSSRSRVITLRNEDAGALLAAVAAGKTSPGLLPWVPLMRGGDEASVVEEWCRLALAEKDERRRGDYGGLARIFAELTGRQASWHPRLEGWDVEESLVVREWQAKARDEGLKLGRDEGRDEILKSLRARLLKEGQTRFKAELPADITAAVKAQHNPDVLLSWYDLIREASDIEALRAGLGLK